MKINLTWNNKMSCYQFNLDPIDTCVGRPCYENGCYAQLGVRNPRTGATGPRYTACTKSWSQNYGAMMLWENFEDIMVEKLNHLISKGEKRFRWFAAGDVPKGKEKTIASIIARTSGLRHLLFTKNPDANYIIHGGPSNANSFYSLWPIEGDKEATLYSYRCAIRSGLGNYAVVLPPDDKSFEKRMDEQLEKISMNSRLVSKVCPGSCTKCRFCWRPSEYDQTKVVMFRAHGPSKKRVFGE